MPHEWKHANVVPIFKKGNRPLNISSMQTPRIITTRSYGRFTRNTQFITGYTARISKRTVVFDKLVRIYGNNIKVVDYGSPVDVIYLDFQKAFDKVPRQRLLIKLKLHGMGVNIVTWMQNWLTDRKQRVSVEGKTSAWTAVHSGCLKDRYWCHYSSSFI